MIYHTPFNTRHKPSVRIWSGTTWLTLPKAHAQASQMSQEAFWARLGAQASQAHQNGATGRQSEKRPNHKF